MLTRALAAMYRRITLGDESVLTTLLSDPEPGHGLIDERTSALVCIAALIAVDAGDPAYQLEVRDALGAGASPGQVTGVLLAVARVTGSARVMSAAPKVALALGYDVDAAFEDLDTHEDER